MDTTVASTVRTPFDLPELRLRLSRFLAPKDALSCALVSKAWTLDFVSAIWFKVDLSLHPRFVSLPTDVIAKHGHRIRIVDNARIISQVSTLDHPSINKLRILQMETAAYSIQCRHVCQIITRNNTSLRAVRVSATYTRTDKINHANYHVSVPAFLPSPGVLPARPSSTIETLTLVSMWMTHDDLIMILEASPRLSKLRLTQTDVVGTPTRFFQHPGITSLLTSLKSIVPEVSTGLPSLLSYFPNLTALHTWHSYSSGIPPSARIKKAFERYCPLLSQFKLGGDSGNTIPEFFTNIVSNVTRITFQETGMTSKAVAAIVLHQASMIKVAQFYMTGFDYENEEVPRVLENNDVSGEMMQEIPRKCSHLQRLNLHRHEMDMDVVESGEWKCKDLRKLRIRVKGLDTKEKILRTIALWRAGCWRRWQKKATGIDIGVVEEEERLKTDQSIEARVARHLLKFEHLQWVWLGYQTWTWIPL